MSINDDECQIAFEKTVEAHPQARIIIAKARFVIECLTKKLAKNYDKPEKERRSYGELVRETLNECKLKPHSDERKAYASLTGHYFGNRGTKNRALKAHQKERGPSPIKIVLERNQYTWDFEVPKTQ